MTLHVPLTAGKSNTHAHTHTHTTHVSRNKTTANLPFLPPFVNSSTNPDAHLNAVFDSILKAKRITVVCGAGISVEAGIPDFRSPDGLFQSLKRDNPKESLSSGKDLFDAAVFKSTEKTALFCRMIASLASLSSQSEPTAFHSLLRTLDDRGQLLRVYTQNIDALEMKAGLSFGVPEFEERFLRGASRVGKAKTTKGKAKDKSASTVVEDGAGAVAGVDLELEGVKKGKAKARSKGRRDVGSGLYSYTPRKGKKKTLLSNGLEAGPSHHTLHEESANPITPVPIPHPPLNTIPRCIPLHGTLLSLHCQHCTQTFPLHSPPSPSQSHSHTAVTPPHSRSSSSSPDPSLFIDQHQNPPLLSPSPATNNFTLHTLLSQGTPPPCPSCTSLEQTRALVGKRLRGVGKLRPSVVLYGEEHREGESVGEAVRRDLCGIEVGVEKPKEKEKVESGLLHPSSPPELSSPPFPPSPASDPAPTPTPAPAPSKPHQTKKTRSRTTPGKGPDLLLVVGTSLRVPGTKRIVREFSKAVRSLNSGSRGGSTSTANTSTTTSPSSTPTPTPTPTLATAYLPTPTPPPFERDTFTWSDNSTSTSAPTQTPTPTPTPTPRLSPSSKTKAKTKTDRDRDRDCESKPRIRTIYLNMEFPSPAREWEDVFDVWVQGDAQVFARGVAALIAEIGKKKNGVQDCDGDEDGDGDGVKKAGGNGNENEKRKREGGERCTPMKRRRKGGKELLLTPPATVHRSAKMKMKMKAECSANADLRSVSSAWSLGEEDEEEDEEEELARSFILDADVDVDVDVEVEEFEDCAIRTLMEMEKHNGVLPKNHSGFRMRRITDMDMEIVPETESEADAETETGSGSGSGSGTETEWDRADADADTMVVPFRDASCGGLTLQLQVTGSGSGSRSNGYGRAYGYGYGYRYGYGYNSPAPTPPPPPPLLPLPSFAQKGRREVTSESRRTSVSNVVVPPKLLYSFGPSVAGGAGGAGGESSAPMVGSSSFGSRSASTTGVGARARARAGVGVGADPFLVVDRDGVASNVVGRSFEVYNKEHQQRRPW